MPGVDRKIDPITKDYVSDGKGSFETTRTIETAVYHQIQGRKGQWWGDADAGSLLHTLQPGKLSQSAMERGVDFVRSALQPFLDLELAADLEIAVARDQRGKLALQSSIVDVQHGEIDLTPLLPYGA